MPTLEEILTEDLGLAGAAPGVEKTAGEGSPSPSDSDEIEKLAAEIGLTTEQPSNDTGAEGAGDGHSKEASDATMDSLYSDLFPEDSHIVGDFQKSAGQEKTAEEVKEAAMGAVAYDSFVDCFDKHITKLAEELTGDATVDTKVKETLDGKPVQTMNDNQPGDSASKIDTAPKVEDEVTATPADPKVDGVQKQRPPAGHGEKVAQVKQAAYRKFLILSNLETEGEG